MPNIALAKQIAANNNKAGVKELVNALRHKSKDIQFDCIKTLYELGELKPELVAGYAKEFIAMLDSKHNRLQWGAMCALSCITTKNPAELYNELGKIAAVAEKGTVITKDHYAKILTRLGGMKQYADDCFTLLIELLHSAPVNQLPTYAENAMPLVNDKNRAIFIEVLTLRLRDLAEQPTKYKRMEKVIKKLK